MGSVVGNPNQVNYPYGGGTDNPGDDTSKPGGPSNVASTETAPLTLTGASLTASIARHPQVPTTIAQAGTDTILPAGAQAVGLTAAGLESSVDRGADPEGGIDPVTGSPRQAGQDEVAGATETTSGSAPSAFPEPNP